MDSLLIEKIFKHDADDYTLSSILLNILFLFRKTFHQLKFQLYFAIFNITTFDVNNIRGKLLSICDHVRYILKVQYYDLIDDLVEVN